MARVRGLTRTKLLQTAERLISRQGFSATRVEQICTEAGVTKGAFFHYFKTKDELGQQALKTFKENFDNEIFQGAWESEVDKVKRLFAFLSHVRDYFEKCDNELEGSLMTVVALEVKNEQPMGELVRDAFAHWRSQFQTLFSEAADARNIQDAKVEDVSMHFLTVLNGVQVLAKSGGDSRLRGQQIEQFMNYLTFVLGVQQAPTSLTMT